MILKIALVTFLTAIFSLILGNVTGNQNPVDLGRVLIFLSVVLTLGSMIWISLLEMSTSVRHLQYRKT